MALMLTAHAYICSLRQRKIGTAVGQSLSVSADNLYCSHIVEKDELTEGRKPRAQTSYTCTESQEEGRNRKNGVVRGDHYLVLLKLSGYEGMPRHVRDIIEDATYFTVGRNSGKIRRTGLIWTGRR